MKIIETKVFQFDELSDEGKEKAREWFREGNMDHDWWEFTYEDAVTIGALMGIEISTSTESYHVIGSEGKPGHSGSYQRTDIYFSGFYSQGDGARFEGNYAPVENALAAIKGHAPIDNKLHAIATQLDAVNAMSKGYLTASIGHRGNYDHAHTMTFDCSWDEVASGENGETPLLSDAEMTTAEDALKTACMDFANWIYRQLEKEYEWQNADEQVDDNIRANEYTFTEDGRRFG